MAAAMKKDNKKVLVDAEMLENIVRQLNHLKFDNAQLKIVKEAEWINQQKYFKNCSKVIAMLRDKRKDFVLESLSQIDASISAITTDVQAFKNIRNRLFAQITEQIQREQNEAK